MEKSRHPQDIYSRDTLKKKFDENVVRIIEYLKDYYYDIYMHDALLKSAFFFISIKKKNTWKDYAFRLYELYTDDTKIRELIEENYEESDIYHSVFVFADDKRKKENVILKANTFVIDVEREDHSEMSEEEKMRIAELFEAQEIHDSGRGLHILIRFEDVVDFEKVEYLKATYETLAEIVNAKVKDLYDYIHADMNATLVTQVVRVPFSINHNVNKLAYIIKKETKRVSLKLLHEIAEFIEEKINRKISNEDEEEVAFIDEEKLNEIADYLSEKLSDVWKKGRRHLLALSLSAFFKKYTNLNEEQVKYIIKKIAQKLNDNEIEDRLRAVSDTYKKDVSQISYFTILYNKLTDAEITYVIDTLKESLNTFAISKFKFKIYALLEKTATKYKFVFMNSKKIQIVEMKKNEEDEFVTVATKEVTNLSFKISKIKLVIDDNEIERYFDVTFYSKDEVYKFKDKKLPEIVKSLKEAGKLFITKSDAENIFARLFEKYKEKYKIETEIIYKTINISYEDNKYVIENDIYKLENIVKNNIDISEIDTNVLENVLNNITKDEHLIVLINSMLQNFFRETDKTMSIITVLEGDKGLGKTTLARLFTRIAFSNEEGTQDTLNSEFRTIELLSKQYYAVLLDDATEIKQELVKILKAVVTGSYKLKRGRSNLSVQEYEMRSSIIITSNEFNIIDDALKDRMIILKVDDYTFKDSETAEDLEFLDIWGWGYLYLQKIIEFLNSEKLTVKELIRKHKADLVNLELSERRKRMYAQIFTFAELIMNIIENEELKRRLERILSNKEQIINELENKQVTESEAFEVDAIATLIETDEELKKTLITREEDSKTVYYISSATIQKLKTKYNIKTSYSKLAKLLNSKVTTIKHNNRVIKVIKFKEEALDIDELHEL